MSLIERFVTAVESIARSLRVHADGVTDTVRKTQRMVDVREQELAMREKEHELEMLYQTQRLAQMAREQVKGGDK